MMAQPLSIEDEEWTYLITTRTAGARLWFIQNRRLDEAILGVLARYQEIYGVVIYAFIIMGNHYHLLARFPKRNRALFMRDFNSAVARLVGRHIREHGRRSVWARRYSYQIVPRDEDILHWFFYVALNPVSSGIVPLITQYPSFNSFLNAVRHKALVYKWIDWSQYLLKRRYDPNTKPEEFAKEYSLKFSRLPGFEDYTDKGYTDFFISELEGRQRELQQVRREQGKGFLGVKNLGRQQPGAKPRHSKQSTRFSFRPLILTLCSKTRSEFLRIYFAIYDAFKEASESFLAGDLTVLFPTGTYPPPRLLVA